MTLQRDGILVHEYGPYILHSNSNRIHDSLGQVDGQLLLIPIHLTTVNKLYGLISQTEEECKMFLAFHAALVGHCYTSEDAVVRIVGRELHEKFFRGYTRKQWGLDPS